MMEIVMILGIGGIVALFSICELLRKINNNIIDLINVLLEDEEDEEE